MFAETLAGIALVKSAVDGIKSAISTAKDISRLPMTSTNSSWANSKFNARSRKGPATHSLWGLSPVKPSTPS